MSNAIGGRERSWILTLLHSPTFPQHRMMKNWRTLLLPWLTELFKCSSLSTLKPFLVSTDHREDEMCWPLELTILLSLSITSSKQTLFMYSCRSSHLQIFCSICCKHAQHWRSNRQRSPLWPRRSSICSQLDWIARLVGSSSTKPSLDDTPFSSIWCHWWNMERLLSWSLEAPVQPTFSSSFLSSIRLQVFIQNLDLFTKGLEAFTFFIWSLLSHFALVSLIAFLSNVLFSTSSLLCSPWSLSHSEYHLTLVWKHLDQIVSWFWAPSTKLQ